MEGEDKDDAPPRHLSADARRLWLRLRSEFCIDDGAGIAALRLLCEARDRLDEARRVLASEGLSVKDCRGSIKAHPLLTTERDCRSAILAALRSLKLEPAVVGLSK